MAKRPGLRERELQFLKIGSELPCWCNGPAEKNFLTPEQFEARLQNNKIAAVLAEYQKAGGNLDRLKVVLFGLTPISVDVPRSRGN